MLGPLKDILIVILIFILLFGALYIRKWYAKGGRIVAYRDALVEPGFKTQRPPEGTPPTVVWIASLKPSAQTEYAYELSRFLHTTAGWTVVVITPDEPGPTKPFRDIPVIHTHQTALVEVILRQTHVLLALGPQVLPMAAATAANSGLPICAVGSPGAVAAIAASRIVPGAYMDPTALVVHPPFYPKAHVTHTSRKYITLIGCSKEDGAHEFYRLAAALPQHSFMAVESCGNSVPPPKRGNLRAVKAPGDLRGVFSQTGILVVMAHTEQFPRYVLESAASGIPTVGIASAAFEEALGPAAIACETVEEISTEIQRLLNSPVAYEKASRAASRRATTAYNSTEELEKFRAFLLECRSQSIGENSAKRFVKRGE